MNFKNLLASFLAIAVILVSCTEDEGASFIPDPIFLSVTSEMVNETAAGFEIIINLSEAATTDTTVNFTIDGTAVELVDYTVDNSTSVMIPEGATMATISFTLIDNNSINENKTIILSLTSTSNELITVNESDTATVTILDDESFRYQNGLLITNEGPFGSGTGTLTFVSNDYTTTEQTIFNTVNSEDLGNIVQSLMFNGDKAYIVVNNSNKVVVANRYSMFKETAIETGLSNPRYMAAIGNNAYLSNWGDASDASDDYIAVVDLTTNTVASTIPVGEGPEQVIVLNDKIYVSHKGGWNQNNIVSVIDTANGNAVSTITVGDVPNNMVLDSANNLWVLCEGVPSWAGTETGGQLLKISTANNTVETTLSFTTTEHPDELVYENGELYYGLSGAIYKMNESSTSLPTTSIITATNYELAIKDNKLYASDAGDYASAGTVKVFDLADNSEITTITTGIIPGGIYFNE